MDSESSEWCWQESATGPYPEPAESSPHPHTVISSHLRLCLPNYFFPSDFPTKILYKFLIFPNDLGSIPGEG
jgi:hypothetical protein